MIDLHLHLLPNVDDGAGSLDVSTQMIDLAAAIGFSTLVATPHLDGPLTAAYRDRVANAWAAVAPIAATRGIDIKQGYEIQLSPDLPHRLDHGEPVALGGGQTVLVELPFVGWPIFTEQTLFDLQSAGYRPLLAHPERYAEAQRDISRLLRLVDAGVPFQVTYGSLVGLFGKAAQGTAEELLRRDAVTVLATDAHSAGQRFETVSRGVNKALSTVGASRLRQLTTENPRALLRDEPLPAPAPLSHKEEQASGFRAALRRFSRR